MKHCIYIIQSEKDQSYYVGYSSDVNSRLTKHNSANSGYTSTKKPWVLVYTEEFDSKTEALRREKQIKRQKSRAYILSLIKERT
jgi:putative endonuclease